MTGILLNALVPIFVVMGLGYFAGWIRDVDNHHVAELNALVMDFALPCALFVATATTLRSVVLAQWPLLLVLVIAMLLLYAACYWMQRRLFRLDAKGAAVQTLTICLPNYAAVGLPLIPAVLGETHTFYVALAIASGSIFPSPLTLSILEATKSAQRGGMTVALVAGAIGRAFLKPIVLGPILGVIYSLVGLPMPVYLVHAFQLIGAAAGGVALFLTGLILSSQRILLNRNVISGTLIKLVAQPLLGLAIVALIPMAHDTARAAILLLAEPAGFFGVLFGLRYGVESHEAGSTLLVSSVLSIVSLAVALILTGAG
jgi:malonate transporter and related proteins